MHSYHTAFGLIAGLIAALSYIPYLRSILKHETRPSRASFGIWAFIDMVEFTSYAASGARATLLLPLVNVFGDIVVFVLSLKRGMGGLQPTDIVCLLGAAGGIVGWVLTNNPHLALYLSMSASICGYIPTLKKVYLLPHSENRLAWGMDVLSAICNVVALSSWQFYLVLYPLYMFVFDTGIVGLLIFPRRKSHKVALRPPRRARQRVGSLVRA